MNPANDIKRTKLGLALKQSEQALRNLRLAQFRAHRERQEHLDQGLEDLAHRLAQLVADIRTLISVMHSQALAGEPEQPES